MFRRCFGVKKTTMPAAACTRRPRVCGDAGAVPCRPQHTGRTAACECRQPNAMIALSLLHHAPINRWGTVVRTLSSRQCPEGSRKTRATRRAQDRRAPLTVKRARTHAAPTLPRALGAGDAGSRSGLRGTRAVGRPAKVAHPLASGVPRGSSLSQPLSVTSTLKSPRTWQHGVGLRVCMRGAAGYRTGLFAPIACALHTAAARLHNGLGVWREDAGGQTPGGG